jgi:hypothetical protein
LIIFTKLLLLQEGDYKMKRFLNSLLIVVGFILLASVCQAQVLSEAYVRYDSRHYADFLNIRGGSEGNSGAYIAIVAGIGHYDELKSISVEAKNLDSDFSVTLFEDDPECVGKWPFDSVDQWFYVRLQPNQEKMVGTWEIKAKYKTYTGVSGTDTKTIIVPRFNFPPEPTGIQISEYDGKKWLVWNSIGKPGEIYESRRVEYRLAHLTSPGSCVDQWYLVRPGGNIPYEMWSGNRIAVEVPSDWEEGDSIRIENRIYDDGGRHNRAVKFLKMR